MEKRLLYAIIIWLGIVFLLYRFIMPQPEKPGQTGATNTQHTNQSLTEKSPKPDQTKKPEPDRARPAAREVQPVDRSQAQSVVVKTEKYSVTLSTLDATLTSLQLVKYKEDGEPIDLVEKNIPGYGNFRVSFRGLENATRQQEYLFTHTSNDNMTHNYRYRTKRGLEISKTYKFYPKKNYFDITVSLENKTGKTWRNDGDVAYSLLWGSPILWKKDKKKRSPYEKLNIVALTDKRDIHRPGENERSINAFQWLGLEDQYFLLAVIPVDESGAIRAEKKIKSGYVQQLKREPFPDRRFSLNRADDSIPDKGVMRDRFRVFVGPKRYSLLTSKQVERYHLDRILDAFVLVKWLAIGIEQLMYLVNSVVGNFAIAIIIVTIIIKLLFYPITHKQHVSMRRMQQLQPKLAALKEQFKNDPQKLNQKTMELYKAEKVNPLGGCLPLILQFPIFFAFLDVLPRMVDLKNVSFLWIKDLTASDTVATLGGIDINPLPLIMTGFSFLQTKISSGKGGQQAQQGKFMMFFPLFLLFILYGLPSGLILYWTMQTVISIFEQMWVNRKFPAGDTVPAKARQA